MEGKDYDAGEYCASKASTGCRRSEWSLFCTFEGRQPRWRLATMCCCAATLTRAVLPLFSCSETATDPVGNCQPDQDNLFLERVAHLTVMYILVAWQRGHAASCSLIAALLLHHETMHTAPRVSKMQTLCTKRFATGE